MKKVGLISLGCDKNLVDSENILGFFDKQKYEIINDPSQSDIIVVNTCGFIEPSKKESIETIFEMLAYGKKVVVTGCLVERYYDELKKQIPEVSLFIPIRDYYRFNELLNLIDDDITTKGGLSEEYRIVSTGPKMAYLKIGDGCSNHCSYCAIPLIRGEYKSRDFNSIIKEAKDLADNGIEELVLLEQDTTRYGLDLTPRKTIVDLLKELLKIESFKFIRLLYLYPDEITDSLIELISENYERLTPYFDVPIQHCEDHILSDMNRRGNKKNLYSLFSKISAKVPHFVLRTTVMVGFPGETNEDFENLLSFIKEIQFDHLGAFTYSREEGTTSYNFKEQINEEIKKQRLDKIMRAQQVISYRKNKTRVGEIMSGFIIGKDKDNYLIRTYWNAPGEVDGKIFVKSNSVHKNGDYIKIKITDAFVYDLLAEEIY